MSKQAGRALADLTATGTNTGVNCGDFGEADMYVNGTFVGTVQVEASADGTNWSPVGSPVTAAAIVPLPASAKLARCHCTAYTSGTIKSQIGGSDPNAVA